MWRLARRVSLRFAFVFLGLLCIEPLWFALPFNRVGPFAAIDDVVSAAGSDLPIGWMVRGAMIVVSAITAMLWTAVARTDRYDKLADRLLVVMRHSLAAAMIGYGFNKVFLIQFWTPTPTDLAQTYGDSSPMALAWRFVGFSAPYMFFGGLLECLGAVLLWFRRTATLGALVIVGVLANVVMLNFCYAISVKLFSLTLGALAVCIAAADYRRIVAFCLQRRVEPVVLVPYPLSPRRERLRRVLKVAWIAMVVIGTAYHCIRVQLRVRERPALWGAYDVETMQRDGAPLALVLLAPNVWQQVVFGRSWGTDVLIVTSDGQRVLYDSDIDAAHGKLTLSDDDGKKSELHYRQLDAKHLELRGQLAGSDLVVTLRLHEPQQWRLLDHEFSWTDMGDWH
jgi:hypothetical protein